MKKDKKGFTLIELIVVIAIIAILAVLIIVRINAASADARHSKRLSDMDQIKTAIQMFQAEGGKINLCPPECNSSRPITPANNALNFTSANGKYPNDFMVGGTYPTDPIRGSGTTHWYVLVINNSAVDPKVNYIRVEVYNDADQPEDNGLYINL